MAKSLYETPTENHGQLCSSKQTSIQDDEYNYHDPMQANIIESWPFLNSNVLAWFMFLSEESFLVVFYKRFGTREEKNSLS